MKCLNCDKQLPELKQKTGPIRKYCTAKCRRYHYRQTDIYKKARVAYYLKNKNAICKKAKKYRKENKIEIQQYKKDYHLKNRERIMARVIQWKKDNKNRYAEYQKNYYNKQK